MPLAQSTPQKNNVAAAEANGAESMSSPEPRTVSTAAASGNTPQVPVGQLVDIPLEGGGESMYEVGWID